MARTNIFSAVSTAKFHYDASARIFTAEASELPNFKPVQVYDDACDVGFLLVNPKSGNGVLFVEQEVKRNVDGDIESWTFTAAPDSVKELRVREQKSIGDLKVVIFND